ncbi:hypothetical protein L1887_62380 [Cichorium endivia]|nr:hypothetical protein L1887_62380 [Cichorium endivia]
MLENRPVPAGADPHPRIHAHARLAAAFRGAADGRPRARGEGAGRPRCARRRRCSWYTSSLTLHIGQAFQGASLFERKLCFLNSIKDNKDGSGETAVCREPMPAGTEVNDASSLMASPGTGRADDVVDAAGPVCARTFPSEAVAAAMCACQSQAARHCQASARPVGEPEPVQLLQLCVDQLRAAHARHSRCTADLRARATSRRRTTACLASKTAHRPTAATIRATMPMRACSVLLEQSNTDDDAMMDSLEASADSCQAGTAARHLGPRPRGAGHARRSGQALGGGGCPWPMRSTCASKPRNCCSATPTNQQAAGACLAIASEAHLLPAMLRCGEDPATERARALNGSYGCIRCICTLRYPCVRNPASCKPLAALSVAVNTITTPARVASARGIPPVSLFVSTYLESGRQRCSSRCHRTRKGAFHTFRNCDIPLESRPGRPNITLSKAAISSRLRQEGNGGLCPTDIRADFRLHPNEDSLL